MSDITADVQRTIDTIIRLTDDDNAASLTSAGELKPGISTSVIPMVLPTILKCFDYNHPVLQQEGAYFIEAISNTPDVMQHTRHLIDNGVIPLLIGNLSPSTEGSILQQEGAYFIDAIASTSNPMQHTKEENNMSVETEVIQVE